MSSVLSVQFVELVLSQSAASNTLFWKGDSTITRTLCECIKKHVNTSKTGKEIDWSKELEKKNTACCYHKLLDFVLFVLSAHVKNSPSWCFSSDLVLMSVQRTSHTYKGKWIPHEALRFVPDVKSKVFLSHAFTPITRHHTMTTDLEQHKLFLSVSLTNNMDYATDTYVNRTDRRI